MYDCPSQADYLIHFRTLSAMRECQTKALALSTALNATDAYSGYAMDNLLSEIATEIRELEETTRDYEERAA